MQTENWIPANECCVHYNIDLSFINYLHEYGLIEITAVEEQQFIPAEQLQLLEKFIRMHYELHINVEGIEAIIHLLERVEKLQEEIAGLKTKINFFAEPGRSFSDFIS